LLFFIGLLSIVPIANRVTLANLHSNLEELSLSIEHSSQYSYLVEANSSHCYVANGTTGATVFSGINPRLVIQNALDHLTYNRTHKETVLLIGEFTVDDTIQIPSYTRLEIDGVLRLGDDVNDVLIENMEQDTGSSHIEISGGIIDGNAGGNTPHSGQKCVLLKNAEHVSIHDLTIRNALITAVDLTNVTNGIVENLHIMSPAGDGIALNSGCVGIVVSDNLIESINIPVQGIAPNGIEIQDGSHDILVSNNTIRFSDQGSSVFGVEIGSHHGFDAVYNVTIIGNFMSAVLGGIAVSASASSVKDLNVIENIVDDAWFGVRLANTTSANIESNHFSNIKNCGYATIEVVDTATEISVRNNVVDGGKYGICSESNRVMISGNVIHNSYNDGIYISKGNDSVIQDNYVCFSDKAGIYIYEDVYNTLVVDNSIIDNGLGNSSRQFGILCTGKDCNITDNIVSAHNYAAIYVSAFSDNVRISRNNIANNWIGIILNGPSSGVICYNNFVNNTLQTRNSGSILTWHFVFEENYWDDYIGVDRNGDLIGDTPHIIDMYNVDARPLMNPVDAAHIPEFPLWGTLLLFLFVTLFAAFIKKPLLVSKVAKLITTCNRYVEHEDC
jgi:parallel beta-helix repeat protein